MKYLIIWIRSSVSLMFLELCCCMIYSHAYSDLMEPVILEGNLLLYKQFHCVQGHTAYLFIL